MTSVSEGSIKTSNGKYIRETFPVLEMTCAACAIKCRIIAEIRFWR